LTRELANFEYHLAKNLTDLTEKIQRRTYRHSGYRHILIQEKKRRDLAVASVADRVVHRLVYDRLVEIFDRGFDADVYSGRRGKGLDKCQACAQKLLYKHPTSTIWRLDVRKFYDNVDHQILLKLLQRKIPTNGETFYLCREIVKSYAAAKPSVGIPIGNLTSQIFANIYLSEFDRLVRQTIRPRGYLRYGDDALLICQNRQAAIRARDLGTKFLNQNLKLKVNPKNDAIFPAAAGAHFCGHCITAKYIVVDRRTTKSALGKVNPRNIASYQALKLAKWPHNELAWKILAQLERAGLFDNGGY
jgi:retron-type reverse transcriptase